MLRKRALDLSRQLDDPGSFITTANLIIGVSWAPHHEQERLELARELGQKHVGLPDGTGNGEPILSRAHIPFLAKAYLQMGERAHAEALWEQLREHATHTQDANSVMYALATEATAATLDGHLEEAVAVGEALRSRGEELGIPQVGRQARILVTRYPLLWLGRTEELTTLRLELAEVIEGVPGIGGAVPLQLQATLLAVSGRVEEASDLVRRLKDEGGHGEEGDDTPAEDLLNFLSLAVMVGDREAAQELYGRLGVLSDQPMSDSMVPSVAIPRILGGAAALLGDPQAARVHYHKALELMGKIRHRPELALTHLELAELLLKHYPDERAEALEHLDTAITELRDMKMQPALERALSHRDILKA